MAIVGGKTVGDQAGRESSSLEKQQSQELWSMPVTSDGGRATTIEWRGWVRAREDDVNGGNESSANGIKLVRAACVGEGGDKIG